MNRKRTLELVEFFEDMCDYQWVWCRRWNFRQCAQSFGIYQGLLAGQFRKMQKKYGLVPINRNRSGLEISKDLQKKIDYFLSLSHKRERSVKKKESIITTSSWYFFDMTSRDISIPPYCSLLNRAHAAASYLRIVLWFRDLSAHLSLLNLKCANEQVGIRWVSPVNIFTNSSKPGLWPITNTRL